MGGGLLQIAANSAIDPVFNDPNYTLFLAVYHKYTPFTIQDYTLKLSSLSDFGKKMEVTIPKVGDLLTDMVLTIELPQVSGEYIFTNQQEYLNSITSQFTFTIMNDVQQYAENLYKLGLGNALKVYLVRDSQIGKYQLVLPLLDATMFLTQGKSEKYDLSSFLASNSQFFDNQYNLHVIKNLNYGLNTNLTNIDYLNYAFQDKEFYFFIANLLNIKQIDPSYEITYYNDWINIYYNTVKKYILRRPELVALNTFIENMNQQITNSIQINNYVFNYPSIFSVAPLDNQYDVILPISLDKNYYLTYTPYEAIINNKNYVLDYTSSFFSIFNRRYVLVKRNNNIIGAANINQVLDVNPIRLILRPFRHILKNNLLNNNNFNLFIHYGFDTLQFETKNFAKISSYKLNINKLHEFTLDRSIEINVGSVIIIGINSTVLPSNNYNEIYGIFQIKQVIKSFSTIDQFTDTGYNTILSATPIEIDQILSTDTILINSNSSVTSTTFYPNYNLSVASNTPSSDLISLLKQNIYSDVIISTLVSTPINSVSQYLLNQIINANDFLLTSSIIPVIQKNIETYISDSYNVLFNYIEKIYYKTILKSSTNSDFLNNIYYMVNYQQTEGIFNFIGAGTTTFANLEDGTFRYQTYIKNIINSQITNDGQYVTLLSYTNFLTSYIIQQYQTLSISYTNDWSASLLNIGQNLSDTFVKILNYVQAGNTSGLQTLLTFTTNTFSFTINNLTNLTITYNKKDVTPTNISNYYSVTKNIPLNLVTIRNQNSLIIDMTFLILSIQDAFNLQNIDIGSIVFRYSTNSTTGLLNIVNIGTFLDDYSTNLISIINNNTNITTQLYGNNILLDYINIQNDTMFGLMKNYEISRQSISRNGGTRYSEYQEDIIDETPLLEDNIYLINFLSEEYFPRFLYSKQAQLYQNIYQKVSELSQNYDTMPSSIYFMNNINYPRTDGYNYTNNNQGGIPYLDPNQFSTILNPTEYAYTLLDRVSVYNILLSPQTFSFMHYLEDLEEHNSSSEQLQYLQIYWNNKFIQSGVNSSTVNNYVAAISGKDDALLIYYIYKYLTELLTLWGDMYNLPVNLDQTYFQTIYQLSPQVLGNLLYKTFSFIMQTTEFLNQDSFISYQEYNSIVQGSQILFDFYNSFNILPQYAVENNTSFNTDRNILLQEITYVFQVTNRLLEKYKINVVLIPGLQLSNYPIVNSIHGSGKLTKIILASDQYTINNTNSNFNSSIAFPTGYYVADYYKLFNLSIHYDYQKYVFFSGYGGILRDTQYPDKTIASFYEKINNYLTASVENVDFAFFYAFQTGSYLPNMEGHIIQSYQAWIQRSAQPYFYYYNLLSQFYDMMYIYSGRSFVSEYYTSNTTNNTTLYNNRYDIIQGATIYANRMAYGTRDNLGRLHGVSMRYNLLDQRLVGIDVNLNQSNINNYNTTQDPIQIFNMLNILNQRFTDYQEFLVLIKNSQNIINLYPTLDIYSTLLTQFKVNSVSMFDLDIFNNWNSFILNYYTTYNYNFSSIITGLSSSINLYNTMASNTLDMSSLGYELYNFTNNFDTINQRNFADTNALRYLNGTTYHHIIDDLITSLGSSTYFSDIDIFNNDVLYWNTNYSLVTLDFLDITLQKIMGPYQSDVSVFKQLFTVILNYRQKNVSTTNQTATEIQLYNDYYSINDVTSLTFYDKFFKFNTSIDYNLIPLIYHDLYNIQNASHTVVFYLNYLYSFLNNTSSKPNISAFDDPNLPVSYYFPKYLSSGIDYFLSNFHQLKFDSSEFYPYKSVPANVILYNGSVITRPKSFMYVFLLLKVQYRNYYYNTVENAYSYVSTVDVNNKPVRNIIGLNMYTNYADINKDVAAFDSIIDTLAITGSIDHLQNITHPFLVNKHIDNLLFIKDLLNDFISVPDNASINTILEHNDNYIEFLNEKTIVTNAFDDTELIYGKYPYTLGVLSNHNTMGFISIINSTGATVRVYIEGNIVLPSLITQIYYFLISECFILNQTELIGSSFQNTPIALGNILGQITAKDWKSGLINLISEYLYLLLKSKKIIYQNDIYEISFNDIYSRLKVSTDITAINDFLDMYINSILTITLTSYELTNNNETSTITSYLGEFEQFKIPKIFSLINIKQNFSYSEYYRLMFGLRQSLIGKYNNFEERVQFHNTYDYWIVNNKVLISDYTTVNHDNINYMVRKSESESIISGLTYYSTNSTNIPPNLFTTIIDYIIRNIQNSISSAGTSKYNFQNFFFIKNGYDVAITLYNVFFTTNANLFNITIDTGSKMIIGTVVTGNESNFTISYNELPFGYQYNFTSNSLMYQQLLYQYDINDVLQNMFSIFQNIQDINQSLTLLTTYSVPYVPGPGVINTSNYNFIYFPLFIESFIYYDFTSATDPAKSVNAVLLPLTGSLSTPTLFNVILTNWSQFYGKFFYIYNTYNPTSATYLATGTAQFSNGIYTGSVYITFNNAGKQYLSLTNALIDESNPYGSSGVAVNIVSPITITSISDGSLDNNFGIITIPHSYLITLDKWKPTIGINQLYVFFSLTSDGSNLKNAAGTQNVANGPFLIESYLIPGDTDVYYRINAIVAFSAINSYYVYVSDKNNTASLDTAQVFALIPNITKAETINIVADILSQSKIGQLDNYTGLLTVPKTYTITLPYWSDDYQINELYVYFANNINGTSLGNDIGAFNIPQTHATITKIDSYYYLSFSAGFKNLGNNYVYLTYNILSQFVPYGSSPVNFLLNELNPIVTTRIDNVTGILSQYISIINQLTTFTITLGNWQNSYTQEGITQVYIYTKSVTDNSNIYTSYIPINNLPDQAYTIENNQVTFTTVFTDISQLNVYVTYNQISSTYNFGEGLLNVQISNPPGSLTVFNYIDVIYPFATNYIVNTLTTFETNTIVIEGLNFSPNYNIYLPVENQLYLFLASEDDPNTIYTTPEPLIFTENYILTYSLYTQSINPVYIFISDTTTYGSGLIAYSSGVLTNVIGNVNALLNIPTFVINDKPRQFIIDLTNWDSSYMIIGDFSTLNVYIGPDIDTVVVDLGFFTITNPSNYVMDFVTGLTAVSGTSYNVFIQNIYLKQLVTNQLYVSDQIYIATLVPAIDPVPTYTSVSYTGTIANWNPLFPSQLYVFAGQVIDTTTPVLTTTTVDSDGNFSFTGQVTQYNFTYFAFSDTTVYSTGYVESGIFTINTIVGPIQAYFNLQSYVITQKPTNYSILLQNWDPTYPFTDVYVYIQDNSNNLLWNYYSIPVIEIADLYYLQFSDTITTDLPTGLYNVYISDTDYGVTPFNFLQPLASPLYIVAQIALNRIDTIPTPFETYSSTTFTGYIDNWVPAAFTNTMYINYYILYDDSYQSDIITITSNPDDENQGIFTYVKSISTLPGIIVGVSDNATYGNGYIETLQLTLNNIIGPVNAQLTSKPYAIFDTNVTYNIVLTNWNPSYFDISNIANLYIYIGSNINTLIYSFGIQNIQYDGTNYFINYDNSITGITQGLYNIYLSDQDPSDVVSPRLVNQLISVFSVADNIVISNVTTTPTPLETYVSTLYSGELTNWFTTYPSTLNLFYTTNYDGNLVQSTVTINSDGTFSFTQTENTLPSIKISLSDSTTYNDGSGYIESNEYTITSTIGPINANLTSQSYAILDKTTEYNIILTNWNASYFDVSAIANLYIYLGSDINTLVYTYGSQSIQFDETNYYINFSSSITGITEDIYNIYLSDQDPTNILLTPLVNQFISLFSVSNNIYLASITPDPFQTYVSTEFTGQLDYWVPSLYPATLNLFYTVQSTSALTVTNITINSDGSFTYTNTENTLPGVTFSLSDSTTYGSGYIESTNVLTVSNIIGPVNADIPIDRLIPNKTKTNFTITLPNWNNSYVISSLYVYIDQGLTRESYGAKTIYLDTDNVYKITFDITPTVSTGVYTMYISDTDPSLTSYAIRQSILSPLTIINQISIASITPVNSFKTYQNTTFNGVLNNWNTIFYSSTMYVTYYSSYDNQFYNQPITISNEGLFSFIHNEIYKSNFNIFITDNINLVHGNGYIESPVFTILAIDVNIGFTNTAIINTYVLPNRSTTLNFTLTNWNASYGINSLYVYIGITPIVSFGLRPISSNTITVPNATINLSPGTYPLYLCNANPLLEPFPSYLVNDQVTNPLNLVNQIVVSSLTTVPSPAPTYRTNTYSGTINNWLPLIFPPSLDVFLGDNYVSLVNINSSGNFNFTSNKAIKYITDSIQFSDNTTYSQGYLKTPSFSFSTTAGKINGTVAPIIYNLNTSIQFRITLTNWNSTYTITPLYIFYATDINFSNLIYITNAPVVLINNVYTVTFTKTFTEPGPFYYVISNVADPVNNPYIIFESISVPVFYLDITFTPVQFQTPVLLSNPNSIPNLFMWFDANEIDGTYLIQPNNNSNITSWTNKTGVNEYDISIPNGNAKFKTNGISNLNSINLFNTRLSANIPVNSFDSGLSVFIVYKNINSDTSRVSLFSNNLPAHNTPYPINVYNASRDFANSTGTLVQSKTSPFNIAQVTKSNIFYFNADSTLQYNEYANGTLNISTSIDYFTDIGTQILFGMDSSTNGTSGFKGDISEILIYNRTLTTNQRKTIEGYLAWKWNLVTSLPSTHPYSYLNSDFVVPNNTYIGILTPYQIILTEYTPNPFFTSFYIQFNTSPTSLTNLTMVGQVFIIQDEQNNYVARFSVQFPSANTYYLHITDAVGNLYKSVTTPIIVTNSSSLITLTTTTPTIDMNKILTLNLNGWSSLFGINSVGIYYSSIANDPNPVFLTNANLEYTFDTYSVSFLVTNSSNTYYYVIGSRNNIRISYNYINIDVNSISVLTPYVSKYTNYVFDPTSITSLTVWLDANTVSGTYLNQPTDGDGISIWNDKSGNGYNAIANNGLPTFVDTGLPSIQLSTENNYKCDIPTGTFNNGMTIFVVYQSTGTPSNYETLISRTDVNIADPFDMYNDSRIIGDSYDTITVTSPITIKNNLTPSIFYCNMDSTNLIYSESNNFINILNSEFTYWNDTNNSGKLYIGTREDNYTKFNGFINEILIFNEPLTKLQKYQVEGYLAYKWNFQIYLPLYHPFTPLQSTTFTPLLIDTMCLWMDASNTASYTIDYGVITQWRDESYYDNVANTDTSFNTIILDSQNDLPTLVFIASAMNIVNTNIFATTPNVTLMFLLYNDGSPSSSPLSNNSKAELFPSSDGDIYTSFGISYTNIGSLPIGWVIYTVVASSVTGDTDFYINGVNVYTGTYNNAYINSTSGWTIGCTLNTGFAMVSTLAEMLVFTEALSDDIRILLEGYLAHKWDVTNLLPVSSPYKSVAPTLNNYNNISEGYLELNLDASSNSNFTLDGSNNILTWIDSSGSNNTLSTTYSNPRLQNNPSNNKQGVYFDYASMEPSNISKMVINSQECSIFTVGYINNTDGRTQPTILATDYADSIYKFAIGRNTNLNKQMSITYLDGPTTMYELKAVLSSNLASGLQNMNISSAIPNNSIYINGTSVTTTNTIVSGNTYKSNFYLGGKQTDTNSFLQNSYIHQVLVYNKYLDDVTRYTIEGELSNKWNIPTSNALSGLGTIKTYKGINTGTTIILENWSETDISEIYVGYNTNPNNLTGLTVIGSFPISELNNLYYVTLSNVFTSANTYYIHLVNESNVQYASINKQIIVQDLSSVISTDTTITIVNSSPYNLQLYNWNTIVKIIGLYSNQITSFNLYIGTSNTDPSPVYVSNVLVSYNSIYYLPIPGLSNVNNKYMFLRTTINDVTITIPPILIQAISFTVSCSPTYGLLNTSSPFTITIAGLPNFYVDYPTLYLYYGTSPGLTTGLTFINTYSVTSGNTISFNYTSSNPLIYYYISTGANFTGITSFLGPIYFVDSTTLSITFDAYDINTNFRNVLLGGWSPYFTPTSLSIFSGPNSNYTSQSLITTNPIVSFTPMIIPGLNAWLDGSSTSNFVITGGNITQWNDSSGNGNNATNPDNFYPVYNSLNIGVNFAGGKYLYLPDNTIPSGDSNYHIFIVLTPSNSSSGSQFILSSFNAIPPGTNATNSFATNTNRFVQSWNNGSDLSSSTYTPGNKQVVSFEYIRDVNRTTYINGVSSGTDTASARNSSQSNNIIGGIYRNNTFTSYIHEIIIYNSVLTVDQRNRMESYLSGKWLVNF